MKKPFENWKERIKNLPTLRFEAVDESATTARMDLDDKTIRISLPPDDGTSNGTRIINDYERYVDFDELGTGGTGIVHSCTDPHLNRNVALKVLRYEHGHDQELRTRFVREARVMAQLEHPNILPIHELGVRPNGTVYYSMKKVNGKSLREILDGLMAKDPVFVDVFPLDQLLDIFQHVCHAMAFAHSRGVIHRDLKPENILIGPFGEVLVLDWGLAKLMGEEEGHVSRHSEVDLDKKLDLSRGLTTVEGEVSGTPFYMSPEQAAGKSMDMDRRTDIYSLGVILYEILALQRPIGGDTIGDILTNVANGRYIPPRRAAPERRIPPELEAISLTAMSLSPEDRYQHLSEMIDDLERYESGKKVSVYEDRFFGKVWKWCRRNPITSSASIAAAIAILFTVSTLLLVRHARLTDFRDEGDRELSSATEINTLLRRELEALQEIQRSQTLKTVSVEEASAIKAVQELEVKFMTHLRNADYLYTKARLRTQGTIPKRLVNLNRMRVEYLIAKKDFPALREQVTYLKQNIFPLIDKNHPYVDEVKRLKRIYEGRGLLSITTGPQNQILSLWRYQEDDSGILIPRFVESLGEPPIKELELEMGSYLIVTAPKEVIFDITSTLPQVPPAESIYFPVNIDYAETESVVIPYPETIPAGMIYVPGGKAYVGDTQSRELRKHERHIRDFFIKKHEVTFGEYLTFWLDPEGANRSTIHMARIRLNRYSYKYEDAWDSDGNLISTFSPDLPIVGVNQISANAYCNWLSETLGRTVRLPTTYEWEKAARGVDGRSFVWGSTFADNLCYTLENRDARQTFGPWAPPGSFYNDTSVYGVKDMAGNVREWTCSTFQNSPYFQIKGGSSSLTQRFSYCSYSSDTPVVPSDVGFRYIFPIE